MRLNEPKVEKKAKNFTHLKTVGIAVCFFVNSLNINKVKRYKYQ